MTNKSYMAGVLQTEAPIDNTDLQFRFKKKLVLDALKDVSESLITTCDDLDKLKKYIFYGREVLDEKTMKSKELAGKEVLDHLSPDVMRMLHASIGMATEAGELLKQLVDSVFAGTPLDVVNVDEECGDALYYNVLLMAIRKKSIPEIMNQNNQKLVKKRYKNQSFTEDAANNRDLGSERKTLEETSKSK